MPNTALTAREQHIMSGRQLKDRWRKDRAHLLTASSSNSHKMAANFFPSICPQKKDTVSTSLKYFLADSSDSLILGVILVPEKRAPPCACSSTISILLFWGSSAKQQLLSWSLEHPQLEAQVEQDLLIEGCSPNVMRQASMESANYGLTGQLHESAPCSG